MSDAQLVSGAPKAAAVHLSGYAGWKQQRALVIDHLTAGADALEQWQPQSPAVMALIVAGRRTSAACASGDWGAAQLAAAEVRACYPGAQAALKLAAPQMTTDAHDKLQHAIAKMYNCAPAIGYISKDYYQARNTLLLIGGGVTVILGGVLSYFMLRKKRGAPQ